MLYTRTRPRIWVPSRRVDAGHVTSQGLAAYFGCNEGGGLVINDLHRVSPGTYSGTTPKWTESPFGPALDLDGSSNYIDVPSSVSPYTAATAMTPQLGISLAIWLFWRASTESYNSLFSHEGSGTGYTFLLRSDQKPAFYNGGGGSDPVGNNTVPFNQWVHLVATWGGSNPDNTVNIYMNGALLDSGSLSNTNYSNPAADLLIGKSVFGAGRFINGIIRDAGLWGRVLSPAEVLDLYLNSSVYLVRKTFVWTSVAGSQNIVGATGIPSAEAFGCLGGTVNVGGNQSIYAFCSSQGIPSAEAFGVNGALAIAPNLTGDAGIPSAEVVGTGGSVGVNPAIVGTYGIPSAEAFGQGAILQRFGPSVFIGNVDLTDDILINTINISQKLSQPATATFRFRDPAGALHLSVGQEVIIYWSKPLITVPGNPGENYTRIFGGTIDDYTELAEQALPTVVSDVVRCSDFSSILDRRIIGKYYDDVFGTLGIIVTDIVNTFLSADGIQYNAVDGDPGINFGAQLFNWVTARQAFNQLSNLTGWDFEVDYYKQLRFFPKSSGLSSAPFNIADNNGNWIAESMSSRSYRGKYRNKQGVRSSTQAGQLWGDIFSTANPGPYPSSPQPPDGIRFVFITLYKITAAPNIKINGNSVAAARIIQLNQVAGAPPGSYDWYWIPGGEGVFQNQAEARLKSTDVLEVDYQTALSPIFWASCPAEIAARAAIEGNSGIYEDVQDVTNITEQTALQAYAQALLNRYGCTNSIPRQVMYKTNRDGLFAGMLQNINTSKPLVPAANYLISQVDIRDMDKQFLQYTITADNGQYQGDWTQFFAAVVDRGQLAQPGNFVSYEWSLVPTIPGVVNPGMTGTGIFPLTRTCSHQVEILQYLSVICNSCPAPSPTNWQILVNGNGVGFPLTPLQAGIEYRFYYQQGVGQTKVFAGDVFQVLSQGTPSTTTKDVTIKLVTSIAVA